MSARRLGPNLVTVEQALRLGRMAVRDFHRRHLDPRLAHLLHLIDADRQFVRADGAYAWDRDGNRYLDLLAGFGALNLGHNPARIHQALDAMREMPTLIEELGAMAGALASNLATLAPGDLTRVHFECSGTEAVDAAIKLARAATGRVRLVACEGAFHGRSIGALSVTRRADYREQFGPLMPDVAFVPFGDADALTGVLREVPAAAFIVEPIQCEGGIVVPPPGYLAAARAACAASGALLVLDEIQTGLGRTGEMFACEAESVVPDVLLLGKALGAGLVPISAVLTTEAIFRDAGGGTSRTPFHSSTYGGNARACAAAIAALEVIAGEDLPGRARAIGGYALDRLRQLQRAHPVIRDVRGRGLLIGIDLAPREPRLLDVLTAGSLSALADRWFSGVVMMHLLHRHRVLTAFTLNSPNVLRLEPPLTIDRQEIDYVLQALDETLATIGTVTSAAGHAVPALARALFT